MLINRINLTLRKRGFYCFTLIEASFEPVVINRPTNEIKDTSKKLQKSAKFLDT